MAKVAVVGSGVIGMTTALALVKAGYDVTIITKERFSSTTSAAAAAIWGPFKAEPAEKITSWSKKSLDVYKELASVPEAGIIWLNSEYFDMPDADLPSWHTAVENFHCDETLADLPAGKRKIFRFRAPVIDTGIFLQYLENLLLELGIQFIDKELDTIEEAFSHADIVVNCSGVGAIKLANDSDLRPARGQVVSIKKQAHHKAFVDVTQIPKLAHVIPRINDTIIGGTYEEGSHDLQPSANEVSAIIERCQAAFPELNCTVEDVLKTICGIRPVRSSVRVEKDKDSQKPLFHNYGHGGSGFTIAWGCAEEICTLIASN